MPNTGYFLSNITTGVFSPCHSDCKTCSKNYTQDNTNCDICLNQDYYYINGNCLENCPNGYYLYENNNLDDNKKICKKCYEKCFKCNEEPIYNNLQLYNMNCLSCKKELDKNDSNKLIEKYIQVNGNCFPIIIYSTEKIVFNISETNSGEEEKTCFLYGKSIIYGQYECIEKPTNSFYVLDNEENTGVLEYCDEACNSCRGKKDNITQDTNCIYCSEGYFKTEDSNTNCILENLIPANYYKNESDNIYYHKCDIQCKTCERYSSETNPNCIECNTEKGYYPANNIPKTHCFNLTTIGSEYALLPIYNEENEIISKEWFACYNSCQSCNILGNLTHQNCLSCKSKYYFLDGTTNCVNESYAKNNGYYFNTTFGKFVKCDKACLSCKGGPLVGNTNCIKCNEEEGYYPIYNKGNSMCFNSETINEGYFLDKFIEPYKWNYCYENCATCEFKGNEYRMLCLSCKTHLISSKNNKTIYFKFSEGNCIKGCPDNLFLTKDDDCVELCPNETYQYIPNSSCVDSCPKNYELNLDKTKCIFNPFDSTIGTTEFKNIISNNISSFVNSSKVIHCTDFKAQIIYSEDIDPIEQIKNGISGIYLGNCIEVLKNEYKIQNGDDLIVVEIETKEDKEKTKYLDKNKDSIDLGKNVKLAIYDTSGNQLNMGFCEEEITIIKYIGDLERVDLSQASEMADQGIDVFNARDSFFNDICHPFKNSKGCDLILRDRRNDLFQNVTFCGDECVYNGIDYSLMVANCICEAELIQINSIEENDNDNIHKKGVTLNDITNSFTSKLLDFNYIVVKCYNLIFDIEILRKNIGFIVIICMNILQVIILCIFSIKGLKPIKNYMLVFEPFDPNIDPPNPPKKIKKTENKKLINLIENHFEENKNMNKKEKQIKETILINNLIQKRKKNNKKKIENKENQNNDNNDTIIVEYLNSEDSIKKSRKHLKVKFENEDNIGNIYINTSNSVSENKKTRKIYSSYKNKNKLSLKKTGTKKELKLKKNYLILKIFQIMV